MSDWSALFGTSLPIAELVTRGTVTYLALLALIRITGQRESGGLGLTDVLLVVVIAEAAAPGLYGLASSIGDTLVLVLTVLLWSVVVDAVAYRWPRIGRVLKSQPRILIEDGQLNRHVVRRELMTHEEIASILRLHGIEDIEKVKRARIEPNGTISVVREDGRESETPEPPPLT